MTFHIVEQEFIDTEDNFAETNQLFRVAIGGEENRWKEPDEAGDFRATDVAEIKRLLQECLRALESAGLSQPDRAQAAGQIRACEEIAEIPAPKWAIVRAILEPLAHVAAIADLVKKILGFFG